MLPSLGIPASLTVFPFQLDLAAIYGVLVQSSLLPLFAYNTPNTVLSTFPVLDLITEGC